MANYTDISGVQALLGVTNPFSEDTVPTKKQVQSFYAQNLDKLQQITGEIYGKKNIGDITLDYEGQENIYFADYPVQSLDKVEVREGDVYSEFDSSKYWLYEGLGKISLKDAVRVRSGRKRFRFVNVVVGRSDLPGWVNMLANKMTAINVLDTVLSSDVYEEKAGLDVKIGEVRVFQPADYSVRNYNALKDEVSSELREVRRNSTSSKIL